MISAWLLTVSRYLAKSGVGVEKVHFPQNSENLGDRKCLGKSRKSFVGHPDAILFLRISQKGVFQQPQAITVRTRLLVKWRCYANNRALQQPGTSASGLYRPRSDF